MSIRAVELCAAEGLDFAQAFRFHYLIAHEDHQLAGFTPHVFGEWVLQTGADLPVRELVDARGTQFGYVFGIGAHHDGRDLAEALSSAFDATRKGALAQYEAILCHLSGRFGCIATIEGRAYLHVDAAGLIGACYDTETGRVASSVNLCADATSATNEIYPEPGRRGEVAFGLTHTPLASVLRLNPNHRLELESLRSKRFWPRPNDAFDLRFDQWGTALDAFLAASAGVTRALIARNKVVLPLSGGLDSRMIFFAAGAEGRKGLAQIYTHVIAAQNRLDAAVARTLCIKADLTHETHYGRRRMHQLRLPVSEEERARAAREAEVASGVVGATSLEFDAGLYALIDRDAVLLRGQQIPILRALFVDHNDPAHNDDAYFQGKLRALLEYRAPNAEADAQMSKAISAACRGIPASARGKIADLIFYECVNAPELAVSFTGNHTGFFTSPFNSREMIRLMMSFPTPLRRENHLFWTAFMRQEPDLAGVATLKFIKRRDRESAEDVAWRSGFLSAEALFYKMVYGEAPGQVPVEAFDLDVLKAKDHPNLP